jgi:hypothetical protein
MAESEIKLPCYGIIVNLTGDGGGAISSDLNESKPERPSQEDEVLEAWEEECKQIDEYNAAVDGIESLILAHACAGIDIETPEYIEGIETAAQAIGNNF